MKFKVCFKTSSKFKNNITSFILFATFCLIQLVFLTNIALANGDADEEEEDVPPPPPPAECPEQDNITYYNPNSIGDCIHPQTIQTRTTRYYYPNTTGGCFHWKTISVNYSYQCVKSDFHYECNSGPCIFYQYLAQDYGLGQKSLGLVNSSSSIETWGSSSYSIKTFNKQVTYSNIRNHETGISYDTPTHESISEVEDMYLYSDPERLILREGGNTHESLQIEVNRSWELCHSNFANNFRLPVYFTSFPTLRYINVTQASSSNFGQFSYSSSSNGWQRDTLVPSNVCEEFESYTEFVDPDLEDSGFRYHFETEGNYTGSEADADSIYDEIRDNR